MKALTIFLLTVASVIVITLISQYLFCPVYSFPEPDPFSGDSLYNPYAQTANGEWVKCNFHAHARCWNGITNGNAEPADIHRVYKSLHYGVAAVSNYQMIDTSGCTQSNYISTYEHGCNVLKNHQLVLGAKQVSWKDYYLPETVSNKQDVLNHLAADTGSLFIINHPMVRNGYCAADFEKLTNYSCMEVLNPACNSSALWDAALSAGKPVFAVGNDDSHDVLDSTKTGKICTWINVPEVNKENIILALKRGNSYGMTIGEDLRHQVRLGNDSCLPRLQNFSVVSHLIKLKFSFPAKEIQVIGANGKVLSSVNDTDSVLYNLSQDDAYARITADYGNGTKLFLNPVFRYRTNPFYQMAAAINTHQTLLFRTIGCIALLFWFNFVLRILVPSRFKNIPLDFLKHRRYGNNTGNAYPKGFEIRYRWVIRHVRRLSDNLDLQRKNRFE